MDPIYWYTLVKRPYVFFFFLVWWLLSRRHLGARPSLVWLGIGYGIAWLSEALSIRTGFPYGWYFYRYENLQNEWLFAGVPIWDSVSYVFLTYAGFCVALYSVKQVSQRPIRFSDLSSIQRILIALATATFTTLLDIIIDPLAHQGAKWFLGDIYYYPNPGAYFSVPMSNFAGWMLVTFCISYTFLSIAAKRQWPMPELFSPRPLLLGLGLYSGVAFFNVAITMWIRHWLLAGLDLIYISLLALILLVFYRRKIVFKTKVV